MPGLMILMWSPGPTGPGMRRELSNAVSIVVGVWAVTSLAGSGAQAAGERPDRLAGVQILDRDVMTGQVPPQVRGDPQELQRVSTDVEEALVGAEPVGAQLPAQRQLPQPGRVELAVAGHR